MLRTVFARYKNITCPEKRMFGGWKLGYGIRVNYPPPKKWETSDTIKVKKLIYLHNIIHITDM